jgi:predicted NAD-dependent protein-ADP-ribosyltransferase YbiA (DUF1768 family)
LEQFLFQGPGEAWEEIHQSLTTAGMAGMAERAIMEEVVEAAAPMEARILVREAQVLEVSGRTKMGKMGQILGFHRAAKEHLP